METLHELKARYEVAFERFSTEESELRRMRTNVPERDVTVWIHEVNAQNTRVSNVERNYRAVRLEYINRLLPRT